MTTPGVRTPGHFTRPGTLIPPSEAPCVFPPEKQQHVLSFELIVYFYFFKQPHGDIHYFNKTVSVKQSWFIGCRFSLSFIKA